MKKSGLGNFIIYVWILVTVCSVVGVGMDGFPSLDERAYGTDSVRCYGETEMFSVDNVNNIQVVKSESVVASAWQMKVARSFFSYKVSFSFLCALIVISALFLFSVQERCVLYENRLVIRLCFHVDYIEKQDGRKKSHIFFAV